MARSDGGGSQHDGEIQEEYVAGDKGEGILDDSSAFIDGGERKSVDHLLQVKDRQSSASSRSSYSANIGENYILPERNRVIQTQQQQLDADM